MADEEVVKQLEKADFICWDMWKADVMRKPIWKINYDQTQEINPVFAAGPGRRTTIHGGNTDGLLDGDDGDKRKSKKRKKKPQTAMGPGGDGVEVRGFNVNDG
jgi:hypothetical protein